MSLSEPEVKVCGITRLEDGENAIALGVSFLGFILFGDSPRCIDPKEARKIWMACWFTIRPVNIL